MKYKFKNSKLKNTHFYHVFNFEFFNLHFEIWIFILIFKFQSPKFWNLNFPLQPPPPPPAPIPVKTMKLNRHPHAASTLEDVPKQPPVVSEAPPNRKSSTTAGAARSKAAPERPAVRYTTQKRRSLPADSASKDSASAADKPSSAGRKAPVSKVAVVTGGRGKARKNATSRGKGGEESNKWAEMMLTFFRLEEED